MNWFWIEFVPVDKAEKSVFQREVDADVRHDGSGLYVHIEVENVDEFYRKVLEKGMESACTPQDFPWGRREFIIRDPDGYKLVFFQKSK